MKTMTDAELTARDSDPSFYVIFDSLADDRDDCAMRKGYASHRQEMAAREDAAKRIARRDAGHKARWF